MKEIPAGTNGCPYARFTTQSYEELQASQEAGGRRRSRLPQRGILEILARRSEVSWTRVDDYDDFLESRFCLYPPRVIQDTSCATLANALDEDMKLDGLFDNGVLGERSSILVMDDLGDGAKTNIRFFKSQQERHAHKAHVLYNEHSKCGVHFLLNAIVAESREDKVVGKVHAVFTVLTVDGRRDALVRNLRELVAEELEIIHGDPPDALKQHNEALIQQTLVRTDALIKARCGRQSEHPPPPRAHHQPRQRPRKGRGVRGKSQAGAARRLIIMVNGDTTRSRCQHFENGCCVDASGAPATREVIVENFVTAVLEAGLLGHRSSRAPASNRWLTCSECLSLISAGMLLHRLLPRV